MPVWSTKRQGDPASVGHRMVDDAFGRTTSPACGIRSEGFFFRAWSEWEEVPERQRCEDCKRLDRGTSVRLLRTDGVEGAESLGVGMFEKEGMFSKERLQVGPSDLLELGLWSACRRRTQSPQPLGIDVCHTDTLANSVLGTRQAA